MSQNSQQHLEYMARCVSDEMHVSKLEGRVELTTYLRDRSMIPGRNWGKVFQKPRTLYCVWRIADSGSKSQMMANLSPMECSIYLKGLREAVRWARGMW